MSKITHEYIRNHFKNNFNANDVRYEDLRIITEYVSQQEKQEKLLELYKELSKLKDDVIHSIMFGKDYEHLRIKTLKIEKQIKELENDK